MPLSNEAYRCPECGEPTEKYLEYAEDPKKGRGKKILISILAVVLVGCLAFAGIVFLPNILGGNSNVATSGTDNSMQPKSELEIMADSLIAGLKEKGYTNIRDASYYNFQEYVEGAQNNPDDFFFLRTTMFELSQAYSNTKFYTNKEALDALKEVGYIDGTYLFSFIADHKDKYGKVEAIVVYTLVVYDDESKKEWSYYTIPIDNDLALNQMLIAAIADKCEPHSVSE